MKEAILYDVAIIGGGLAGLSLAIQLARSGRSVILFEKEHYPFHKVCGEYISMESWPFLESLGLPLGDMNLPRISSLEVTAPSGISLQQQLDLGGFGISRYLLDERLKQLAEKAGAKIMEGTRVESAEFLQEDFTIETTAGNFRAAVCCGSFGKRSNLDVKWKRSFTRKKSSRINNLVGIKYHVKAALPQGLITLHNFHNGYCGISQVENDTCCLCYLTTAENLKASSNSIEQMEKQVLSANPKLAILLANAEKLFERPVSISQISLDKKLAVEDHVLLLGDAAGMIAPLCGNGMSMALHSSKILATCISMFLEKKISRDGLEKSYASAWKKVFARRLLIGRTIQRLFGKTWVTNLFIQVMNLFPGFARTLIRQTHGKPF